MTIVSNVTAFDNRRQWNDGKRQTHLWNNHKQWNGLQWSQAMKNCNNRQQWYDCKLSQQSQQLQVMMWSLDDRWMDCLQCEQRILCSLQHNGWITCSAIDCRDAINGMGAINRRSVIDCKGVIDCFLTKCRMKNLNPRGAFCWRIWSSHVEGAVIQYHHTLTLRVYLCWWFYRNTVIIIFCKKIEIDIDT